MFQCFGVFFPPLYYIKRFYVSHMSYERIGTSGLSKWKNHSSPFENGDDIFYVPLPFSPQPDLVQNHLPNSGIRLSELLE